MEKVKTGKLAATVAHEEATDKTIAWSSSDTNVATVDSNGNINAVNHGEAKITAMSANGRISECEVRVNFIDVTNPKDWYYKPVYWAVGHGIVTGSNGYFYHAKEIVPESRR